MHTIINENEFQTKKVSATNFQCTEKKLLHRCPAQFPACSHQNVHRMSQKKEFI